MIHPEYNTDRFPHWTSIPIRYRDLDPLGHVNNAIYFTYYEEARIDFIRNIPEMAELIGNRYTFVLANVQIDFIHPVEYPAVLKIGTGIQELGNTSITSFQAIYREDSESLVSTAESTGIWFDLNEQRPGRLPEMPQKDQFVTDFQ